MHRGFPRHMQPGRLWSTRVRVTQAISIPRSGVVASHCIFCASASRFGRAHLCISCYREPRVMVRVLGSEIQPTRMTITLVGNGMCGQSFHSIIPPFHPFTIGPSFPPLVIGCTERSLSEWDGYGEAILTNHSMRSDEVISRFSHNSKFPASPRP